MKAIKSTLKCIMGSLVFSEDEVEVLDDYFDDIKKAVVHYEEAPTGPFDIGAMWCIFHSTSAKSWRKAVLYKALASRLSEIVKILRRCGKNFTDKAIIEENGQVPTREFRKSMKRAVSEKTLTKEEVAKLYLKQNEKEAFNALMGNYVVVNPYDKKTAVNARYYYYEHNGLPSDKDFVDED